MTDESDNQPSVRVSFSLPLGGAQLNASAVVPAGRTTLTALLPIIQNLENAMIAKASEEASAAGTPISCGPRCGACCRQLVPVSLFEAEALTSWLRSLPEEQRRKLEARFHHALLALRDAGVIDKLVQQDWTTEKEAAAQLAIDYFHAAVPCPFLDNESCSIHPIRPLSCREYMVTSSPELCRDPSIHQVSGVQLPLKLSRALFRYGAEIEHDPRGWLPLVFLLAWGRSGATPGDRVSGTGEEVLRGFLENAIGSVPTEPAESA